MSIKVHITTPKRAKIELIYNTPDVTIGSIKQVVAQQIGPGSMAFQWSYTGHGATPQFYRVVHDHETLRSLGIFPGSHCGFYLQEPVVVRAPIVQTPTLVVAPPTYVPPPIYVAPAPVVYAAPQAPVLVNTPGKVKKQRKPWAHPPQYGAYQTIVSKATGHALEVTYGNPNPGAPLNVNIRTGAIHQRFAFDHHGYIRSQQTGLVVEMVRVGPNQYAVQMAPQRAHSNDTQRWFFKRGFICNKDKPKFILSSSPYAATQLGAPVIVEEKLKGRGKRKHQKWNFTN